MKWMDQTELPTPSYVIDEEKLVQNLTCLKRVEKEAGCHILLAQKAFSMFCEYPLIGTYLSGTTASGLYEARLGKEYMPDRENHIFSPAYKAEEMEEIISLCDHIIFNSFSQWRKYRSLCSGRTSPGLRINPEHSTQKGQEIYDPCAPGSRLGIPISIFEKELRADPDLLGGIEGLHFHTLCEQNSDALEETLEVVEEKYGTWFSKIKWLNMGGGHHITREDYDIDRLIRCIKRIRETYGLEVYLEPGEAVALQAGTLVTEVLDVVENESRILILDASAACHMPDVLEMPYRPEAVGAGKPGEKKYTYRLASCTCLAGDVIGDYSFDRELVPGDRICFLDMAIYSMVKNNTFS